MRRREGYVKKCECGKLAYPCMLDALRAVSRLRARRDFEPLRIYRCPRGRCLHLTRALPRHKQRGWIVGHA